VYLTIALSVLLTTTFYQTLLLSSLITDMSVSPLTLDEMAGKIEQNQLDVMFYWRGSPVVDLSLPGSDTRLFRVDILTLHFFGKYLFLKLCRFCPVHDAVGHYGTVCARVTQQSTALSDRTEHHIGVDADECQQFDIH